MKIDNGKWKIKCIFFFLFLVLTGCGYKPSSVYQNKLTGDKVKIVINIDVKNPRTSIFIKDSINDAVYSILSKNVCYNNCNTILKINSSSYSLSVLDYDQNGYPVLYRANVNLNVTLTDKNKKTHSYSVNGIYDFRIESNSVLNDEVKLNAYKNASINALNKLFALIAKDGVSL